MITFIVFEGIVVVHYGLILKQTLQPNNNWYTWICLGKLIVNVLCSCDESNPISPYFQSGDWYSYCRCKLLFYCYDTSVQGLSCISF